MRFRTFSYSQPTPLIYCNYLPGCCGCVFASMGPAVSWEETDYVRACQHSPEFNVSMAKPLKNKRTTPSSVNSPWKHTGWTCSWAALPSRKGALQSPPAKVCVLRPLEQLFPEGRVCGFGVFFIMPSGRLRHLSLLKGWLPARDPHLLAPPEGPWLGVLPSTPK